MNPKIEAFFNTWYGSVVKVALGIVVALIAAKFEETKTLAFLAKGEFWLSALYGLVGSFLPVILNYFNKQDPRYGKQ